MPTQREVEQSQATTISSSSAETTIVTADPNFRRNLTRLIVTTTGAAAATLTLRDTTGGTARIVFDYPNAAVAPTPLIVPFDPPLQQQAVNTNWTIQSSSSTTTIHITADFVTGN